MRAVLLRIFANVPIFVRFSFDVISRFGVGVARPYLLDCIAFGDADSQTDFVLLVDEGFFLVYVDEMRTEDVPFANAARGCNGRRDRREICGDDGRVVRRTIGGHHRRSVAWHCRWIYGRKIGWNHGWIVGRSGGRVVSKNCII